MLGDYKKRHVSPRKFNCAGGWRRALRQSCRGGAAMICAVGHDRIEFQFLTFYCKTEIKALHRAFSARKMRKFGNRFQKQ